MQDVIRSAALTGMRRSEIFKLQVANCAGGIFDITAAKSEAGVRAFSIHSNLLPIIARRVKGKKLTDFLIKGGAKDRADAFGKAFGDYRKQVGATDKLEGRRQDRIDFHSLRRWFVTEARKGFDRAVVAAASPADL
jgi:integrase